MWRRIWRLRESELYCIYSESNMAYLKKVIADIESGKAVLVEHELIED